MVTINGNANISGNIAILGDNASVSILSGERLKEALTFIMEHLV